MATLDDVRRISLSLPNTIESDDGRGYSVLAGTKAGAPHYRGFCWTWNERIEAGKPRVPNRAVLAIRTANNEEKDALLSMGRPELFTEPHYNGFPAVLVRLAQIEVDELEDLLIEGWRALAPKRLVKAFDAGHGDTT
jgi:hypothetical protein